MNKTFCLAAALLAVNFTPAVAQPPPGAPPQSPVPRPNFEQRLATITRSSEDHTPPALTTFSLDFKGGSPSELIAAIEKAMGKPLNVIINQEDEDVILPPLKMNDVALPQLFAALQATSRKTVAVSYGNFGGSYTQVATSYGFNTSDNPVSDTSIWYFHYERPLLPPVINNQKVCQFYSLADYLDRGFTVDDITTAIQTGWKLSGEATPPELDYHKETRLLIAYGDPEKLKTINQVLQTLPTSHMSRVVVDDLWHDVHDLQVDVAGLKKEMAGLRASTNAPEEKSGK